MFLNYFGVANLLISNDYIIINRGIGL